MTWFVSFKIGSTVPKKKLKSCEKHSPHYGNNWKSVDVNFDYRFHFPPLDCLADSIAPRSHFHFTLSSSGSDRVLICRIGRHPRHRVTAQYFLHLEQTLALRFGHHHVHEQHRDRAASREEPKRYSGAEPADHQRKQFRHDEHARPVRHARHTASRSFDLRRENLGNQHPRNRSHSQRKQDYVRRQAEQRKPTDGRNVFVGFFQVEIQSEGERAQCHDDGRHYQQNTTSQFVHDQRGDPSRDHLRDSDQNRRNTRIDLGSCTLQNETKIIYFE